MIFRGEKNPRLSHSPLLEVNRTGSLLIVKSTSSNPSSDTQEQAPAQRLLGSSKIHTHTDLKPFVPSSFKRHLLLFYRAGHWNGSLFLSNFFSTDLSTPPPPPSFLFFLLPSSPSNVSLSPRSLLRTNCMDSMLHLKTLGHTAIPCSDYGLVQFTALVIW